MNVHDHNSLLRRATRRAEQLEDAMEAVLVPILDRWAGRAADAFQTRATAFYRSAVPLAAAASNPLSCMVAVYPRPEEAAALVQPGGEPAEILHTTVVYIGDVDDDQLRVIHDALRPVVARFAPLEGKVGGVGSFGPERFPNGTMRGPSIVLPDVAGLSELRVAVTEALVDAGVEYARAHGFCPHITLSYTEGTEVPPADLIGLPLHFDALVLTRGDVPDPLPFFGPAPLTAATPAWGAPFPNELIDIDALIAELRTKTDPVRLAVIATMMTEALERVGLSFDVKNPFTARVLAQSGSQIVNIAGTTRLNVMRIVRASLDEGLSIPDTAKAIRAGMREASPARARLIARTEIVGATNGGSLAATRIVQSVTGERLFKKWLTAPYAKNPRHSTYMGLHGQTRPLGEAFSVGGASLDHPGDSAGPPHEICNCRCALVYTDEAEDEESARVTRRSVGPPEAAVDAETMARIAEEGLDEWPPRKGRVAKRILGNAASTEDLYGANQWEARRALHQTILDELFADKTRPSKDPTAFFTAGGAASGKGSARFRIGRKRFSIKQLRGRADTLVIDPDEIKRMLPEYRRMKAARDSYASSAVHEESSFIAQQAMHIARRHRLNIVVDGVGGSGPGQFVSKMLAAKADGYRVQVQFVSAPTNRAIERMVKRGDNPDSDSYGRYVALDPLKTGHRLASERHLEWREADFVDRWSLWDNTTSEGRVVAEGVNGVIRVYDREMYERILAKQWES